MRIVGFFVVFFLKFNWGYCPRSRSEHKHLIDNWLELFLMQVSNITHRPLNKTRHHWDTLIRVFTTSRPNLLAMGLFVSGLLSLLTFFFSLWRRHYCQWRAASFDLFSALITIEQCLICVTGHPFIMVISEVPWHTPIALRLTVHLSLPVFTT